VTDLVVVGAGTVGGWAAWFARRIGGRVTVVERGMAGQGASSRAAGIVRAQGGTPTAVALGRWSIDFYERQRAQIGADSGFRRLGYLLLARDEAEAAEAHERIAMQQREGLDVRWVEPDEAVRLNPTLSPDGIVGASYSPIEGCIDPPRNVRAYMLALQQAGVEVRERCECEELLIEDARVVGVRAGGETISCSRVILTGGPTLSATARRLGFTVFAGGARHQVAVSSPHQAFAGGPLPMVFDVTAGVYWRQEEDGLLFGWSDPEERPGEARAVAFDQLEEVRARLAADVPATAGLGVRKVWAATIDYTPDHLPILASPVEGLVIASAAGHGMMWGPAVARAAAQLALTGGTDVVDVTDLGLDRFDAEGRSRLATDPIALPFPAEAEDAPAPTGGQAS
jgi:sarcosine oxidase, subunit beta